MFIPLWLFITVIYLIAVVILIVQSARDNPTYGFDLIGCFGVFVMTILYMGYWIIKLAWGIG